MGKRVGQIILIAISIAVLVEGFIYYEKSRDVVIIVNDEKIKKEEFEFLSSCPVPYLDCYSDEIYDEKTRKVLLIKAEQILLKEKGIINDNTYKSFLEQFDEENEKRKEAFKNGDVIYGPKQYDKKVYFDYCYSEYRDLYKSTILSEPQKNGSKRENEKNEEERYKELLQSKVEGLRIIKK